MTQKKIEAEGRRTLMRLFKENYYYQSNIKKLNEYRTEIIFRNKIAFYILQKIYW